MTPSPTDATLPVDATRPDAVPVGDAVAGYELLGELGRGGMGVVYKARQVSLNRVVALKMILSGAYASADDLARFLSEAEAIARMQHPNIVQIFETGRQQNVPYFTLEFVDGGSLAARLDGTPLKPDAAAALVEALAHGIDYAHRQGIVHRDLKPANVLLTADGTPKITDFGLAKKAQGDGGLTRTGAIMGTPSYMAPEQADGRGKEAGPAADVYALGAILYECLTGRPPFRAATPLDTILQVVNTEPVPPARLQPQTPRDLETICLKCLQKDGAKRYAAAADLAEDLRRFRAREPIRARPVGPWEKASKWVRRRPAIATLLGSLVGLAAASAILIGLSYGEVLRQAAIARDERDKAKDAEGRALGKAADEAAAVTKLEAALEQSRRALANSQILLAQEAWDKGNFGMASEHLDRVPDDLRFWDWQYLRRLYSGSAFTIHGQLALVDFSVDGRFLFAGSASNPDRVWDSHTGEDLPDWKIRYGAFPVRPGRQLVFDYLRRDFRPTGDIVARDAETGQAVFALHGQSDRIWPVIVSPDGERLASVAKPQNLQLLDAHSGKLLSIVTPLDPFYVGAAFSPGGDRLAVCSQQSVKIYDLDRGRPALILAADAGLNYGPLVAFSPDGGRVAVGEFNRTLTVWDAFKGERVAVYKGHVARITNIRFSPDGLRLVSQVASGAVKVWGVAADGQRPITVPGTQASPTALAYSADGKRVAMPDGSGRRLWTADTTTGRVVADLAGHQDFVGALAFSADGRFFASASREDGMVLLWDARTLRLLHTLSSSEHPISCLAFTADGCRLAVPGPKGELMQWSTETGLALPAFDVGATRLSSLAFSPDGKHLVLGAQKSQQVWELKVCDATTGREIATLDRPRAEISWVAFSADGSRLAAAAGTHWGGGKGEVRVWDVRGWRPLFSVEATVQGTHCFSFSPSGRRLVTLAPLEVYKPKVWDADTGQELLTLTAAVGRGGMVAFNPDGRQLAVLQYTVLELFDSGLANDQFTLNGHTDPVVAVNFSPDGGLLATGGLDGMVRVWDTTTHRQRLAVRLDDEIVGAVGFSADGKRVLAVGKSLSSTKMPWRIDKGDLVPLPDAPTQAWDVATGEAVPGATDRIARSFGGRAVAPGGRHVAVCEIARVWLSDKPPLDEAERQRRRQATTVEPFRHRDAAAGYEHAGQWYPAAFHWSTFLEEQSSTDAATRRFALVGKAVERDRKDLAALAAHARLSLDAGKMADYCKDCASLASLTAERNDERTRQIVARTCMLAPDALPDFQPLLAAQGKQRSPDVKDMDDERTLCGLLLRAGRPEDAVRRLQDVNSSRALFKHGDQMDLLCLFGALPSPGLQVRSVAVAAVADWDPYDDLLLALAYHQLRKPAEARRHFARAIAKLDTFRQALRAGDVVLAGCDGPLSAVVGLQLPTPPDEGERLNGWERWLEIQILRREAEAALGM